MKKWKIVGSKQVAYCRPCGRVYYNKETFCPLCGLKLQWPDEYSFDRNFHKKNRTKIRTVCEKCGREYKNGEKFCAGCGGRVINKTSHTNIPFKRALIVALLAVLVIFTGIWLMKRSPNPADSTPIISGNNYTQQQSHTKETFLSEEKTRDSEDVLAQYIFKTFVNIDEESCDGFWALADYAGQETEDGSVYVGFDSNLNYICSIDAQKYTVYGGILDGLSLGYKNSARKFVILDLEGNDVSSRYFDKNKECYIVDLVKDDSGITVWTYEITDTYNEHILTLNAKDTQGNLKHSWVVEGDAADYRQMKRYGGMIFFAKRGVFNVVTGEGFTFPRAGNNYYLVGADENGNVYAGHNGGTYTTLEKYTSSGTKLWHMVLRKGTMLGTFSEGLIYVRGTEDEVKVAWNGFVDTNGNYVADVNLENISHAPVFKNGYALVECQNKGNVRFVTLINKQGQMLFEPIPGQASHYESEQYLTDYPIWVEDGLFNLNEDGSTTVVLKDNWDDSGTLTEVGGNFYRIVNGKITKDTTLAQAGIKVFE